MKSWVGPLISVLAAVGLGALAHAQTVAIKPAVVFSTGGKFDKSFNEGVWQGAERFRKETNIAVAEFEPSNETQFEQALRRFAQRGQDPIIAVGFSQAVALGKVAREFPNIHFTVIDSVVDLPNVQSVVFKEQEGSFLVGVLAAMASKTGKIGFVGGMDISLIHKFEAGYRAGVKHVCPDCTVIANYAGVTPDAFRNPGRGKEMALAMYNQGVNVIFHASGSTGLGVFEAARTTGKLAIGVDADQYGEAPGFILTSMVKGIDASVVAAVRAVKDGSFTGGVQQFGLAEQGVGYIYDGNNRALIPDSVRATLDSLTADIIAGRIVVPATREGEQ